MRQQSENLLLLTDPTRRPDLKYRLNPIFSAPTNEIYRCSSATDREKTFENIIRKYILDTKRRKLKKIKKKSLLKQEQVTLQQNQISNQPDQGDQQPGQVAQNTAQPRGLAKKRRRLKGTPKQKRTVAQQIGKIVGGVSSEMIQEHKKNTKMINDIIENGSVDQKKLIDMVHENINKVNQSKYSNINAV